MHGVNEKSRDKTQIFALLHDEISEIQQAGITVSLGSNDAGFFFCADFKVLYAATGRFGVICSYPCFDV